MKKALVIGAAISGTGAACLLRDKGYDVYLTDTGKIGEKEKLESRGIHCLEGGNPDFLKRQEYEWIVKNPGIPDSVPFVQYFLDHGKDVVNEIEVAVHYAPEYRIGAVTGTNGKTTTTTLLGKILQAKDPSAVTAGNIGKSLCSIVREKGPQARDVALEIAAFQLDGTRTLHPKAAVILNLTPDHLNVYGTPENYYHSKTLVYRNMRPGDVFFRNVDDPVVEEFCARVPCDAADFSLTRQDVDEIVRDGRVLYRGVELFQVQDLKIPGRHNLQNAMAAAGMAYVMGADPGLIRQAVRSFQGVEHRIEFTAEINGVKYYNDSKGTNTEATIAALKTFDCPIRLLAGGYDKHLSFEPLRPYLPGISGMYVFGETKEKLKELNPSAQLFDTMEQAVHAAYEQAKPGEVVLLSPCCASWDQFPNYEERGRRFKEIVRSLQRNG